MYIVDNDKNNDNDLLCADRLLQAEHVQDRPHHSEDHGRCSKQPWK